MTSAQAQELAQQITRNDTAVIGPLIKLLYAFRDSRGDPLGEVMMSEVIGYLYIKTSHCDESIKEFVSLAA